MKNVKCENCVYFNPDHYCTAPGTIIPDLERECSFYDDLLWMTGDKAEKGKLGSGNEAIADNLDTVACSLAFMEAIASLAKETADALEGTIEIPIYDEEVLHYNCTVQVLRNSITGETSVGWWEEGEV